MNQQVHLGTDGIFSLLSVCLTMWHTFKCLTFLFQSPVIFCPQEAIYNKLSLHKGQCQIKKISQNLNILLAFYTQISLFTFTGP